MTREAELLADTRVRLRLDLVAALSALPGQTSRDLTKQLTVSFGWSGLSKGDVNSVLYAERTIFQHEGAAPPLWHALETINSVESGEDIPHLDVLAGLGLRPWQERALRDWATRRCRGVVEAVTGTGKTYVGLGAAALANADGVKTAVIVPTQDLQNQWAERFATKLPKIKVGKLGNDHQDNLERTAIGIT